MPCVTDYPIGSNQEYANLQTNYNRLKTEADRVTAMLCDLTRVLCDYHGNKVELWPEGISNHLNIADLQKWIDDHRKIDEKRKAKVTKKAIKEIEGVINELGDDVNIRDIITALQGKL